MQNGSSSSIVTFNSRCPYHTRRCKCAARRRFTSPTSRDARIRLFDTPSSTWSKQELAAKEYYQSFACRDLMSWGHVGLWQIVLPRHAETSAVVRASFVAVSLGHREAGRGRKPKPAVFAAYGRALRSLREYHESPTWSSHDALIACTVLQSVGRILGDLNPPHLDYALHLVVNGQQQSSSSSATQTVQAERRVILNRLGTMVFLYYVGLEYSNPLLSRCQFGMAGNIEIPEVMATMFELQHTLQEISIGILDVLNTKTGREAAAPRLTSSIADWSRAANKYGIRNAVLISSDPDTGQKYASALIQGWYCGQLNRDVLNGERGHVRGLHSLVAALEWILDAHARVEEAKPGLEAGTGCWAWALHIKEMLCYAERRSCCLTVRRSLGCAINTVSMAYPLK